MPQLEADRRQPVHAHRLRRATEEYLYRVLLVALTQSRSRRPAETPGPGDHPTVRAA